MKKILKSRAFLICFTIVTAFFMVTVLNSLGGIKTDMLPKAPVLTSPPSPTPAPSPSPTASSAPDETPEATPRTYTTLSKKLATVKDESVVLLQERLRELGYYAGEADGYYSDNTFYAVLSFQRMNGLNKDGIAGPGTQQALFEKKDVLDAAGRVFVPLALRTPTPAPTPTPTPRCLPDTDFSAGSPLASGKLGGAAYSDGSISARCTSAEIGGGSALTVEVSISHPSQLRGALAGSVEIPATLPFEALASSVNAVIAVPGTDYLSSREVEIRQGTFLRDRVKNDMCLMTLDSEGTLRVWSSVGKKNADIASARQAMSVDTALLINGIAQAGLSDAPAPAIVAIGEIKPLSYLIVRAENASEKELAAYFKTAGCENAAILCTDEGALLYSGFSPVEGFSRDSGFAVSNILYFASIGEEVK